jgi:hypothetical protein
MMALRRTTLVFTIALTLVALTGTAGAAPQAGTKSHFCATIRPELAALVKDLKAPGAVVLVGHRRSETASSASDPGSSDARNPSVRTPSFGSGATPRR